MADKVFVDGIFLKERTFPNGGTVTSAGFAIDKFVAFLKANDNGKGMVNIDIKKSLNGEKIYAELNTYVPQQEQQAAAPETPAEEEGELPF